MATVTAVRSTEATQKRTRVPPKGPGNGNGRNGKGPGGSDDSMNHAGGSSDSEKYRIGIWVVLAGVTMMFTALTSAYIVRSVSIDGSRDWQPISMPKMVPVSTVLILISSVSVAIAGRMLRKGKGRQYRNWLLSTGVLGVGFLVSQLISWKELVAQGIYLASNPHSSFFYLLTAVHGLHIVFGLLGLAIVLIRGWNIEKSTEAEFVRRTAGANALTVYWHFMDGLWIYLFLLLFVWR